MLKCREVARQASDFVDHRIPWYQRPAWYLHLMLCNHCRRFIRHLRAVIKVAKGLEPRQTSTEEVEKIVQACEHEKHKARNKSAEL
jgi:hypothetical protein